MSKKRKNQVEEKRDNWFVDYHDIPELGIEGKRKINDRIQHYDRNDFLDATVIDLGCNMGQTAFQAEKWGAKQVVGVEYDAEAISKAFVAIASRFVDGADCTSNFIKCLFPFLSKNGTATSPSDIFFEFANFPNFTGFLSNPTRSANDP